MTEDYALTPVLDKFKHEELKAIEQLRVSYREYCARCDDLHSTTTRRTVFPMSFDDWVRTMFDNAKDEAKYEK